MYFGKPYYPRSGLYAGDILTVTNTTSLNIDSQTKVVLLNSPANYTVTLSPINQLILGTELDIIHNHTSGTVTIVPYYTDFFRLFGVNITSLQLNPGDAITLKAITTSGQWMVSVSNRAFTQPQGTPGTYLASTGFVLGEFGRHTNPVINPNMIVWQKGTTFSLSNQQSYTADGYLVNTGTSGAATVSRSAFTFVTGEQPFYGLNINQTANGTGPTFSFRLDGVQRLSNVTVTISIFAVASAGITLPSLSVIQNFGTGGSPSAAVTTVAATNLAVTTTRAQLTATVAIPSISGKVLGTNANDFVEIQFSLPSASTFNITFDNPRVDIGLSAAGIEVSNHAVEWGRCLRYFEAVTLSGKQSITSFTTTSCETAQIPYALKRAATPVVTVPTSGTSSVFNNGLSSSVTSVVPASSSARSATLTLNYTNPGFSTTAASYYNVTSSMVVYVDATL